MLIGSPATKSQYIKAITLKFKVTLGLRPDKTDFYSY